MKYMDANSAFFAATDIVSATGTSSGSKPTGTGSFAVYPTGSAGHSGNSTVPNATGGPKPSGTSNTATGSSTAGLPESTGAAGRMEIGVVAVLAGLMAVAL